MTTPEIISWFAGQALIVLFTLLAAWHHAPAVNAFRRYVRMHNTYEDPFHFWGAGMAILFTVVLSLGLLSYHGFWTCVVFGKLSFCWYWLLFDPVLNKNTGKSWDYLRSTGGLDGWLTDRLGKNAGECKAVVLAISILSINILKFVL